MDEGPIIATLAASAAVGGIAFVVYEYRKRWDVEEFSGVPVRFDDRVIVTLDMIRQITGACSILRGIIAEEFPGRGFEDYSVEVRRKGRVGWDRQGRAMGGTIDVERAVPLLPFFPRYVAIVQDEHVAAFIAHEVTRHLIPRRLGLFDPDHELERFAKLETWAKREIALWLASKAT